MSLAITKTNFEQLIDDPNNGVIALSGKWGTGKSYLWRQVQKDSANDAIKNALYVSLFGVKDILQLKLKILQSAVPDSKTGHVARDVVTTAWKESSKFLKTLHPGFAALDEIALLAVPAILRKRVIVIDDIERKHDALSIEEVMGFIDEFTQVYGSRILLILNSDQLADKGMWDALREKVIDHEIALETTPDEAFDIASGNVPSTSASFIRAATVACGITNIRIIQKIIRVVERLLSARPPLPDEVLSRIVPSTTLLSAIHFKGLVDGPNVDYVLKFNSLAQVVSRIGRGRQPQEETEADRDEARWAKLMGELGINEADEFETAAAAFLKTGLLDSVELGRIFDRYLAEKERYSVHAQSRTFFERRMWHPELSDVDLLAAAEALLPNAHLLGPYEVTAMSSAVAEMEGGAQLAADFVSRWLTEFQRDPPTKFAHDTVQNMDLHPSIQIAFDELIERLNPVPTLLDACAFIAKHQGWGDAQTVALRGATPAMFEAEIRRLSGEDLKLFMNQNVHMLSDRANYDSHFGTAMAHFAMACRAICDEGASPRLARMIRIMFERPGLSSMLTDPAPVPTGGEA